ncbi:gamma-glutamylcyclotransferase [Aquabacterium sp. A7-Y]|uniref:gamma-glutamylcyclotransferase n=1 Tax=Aquabacterium sp. A7-Y TaxID=1349605 RepID=UPI00223E5C0E|nr:gamma-glutamylcyclotransferase [Aquabacterium sp. A7-Y]MCW7539193.1 gamma-glutamylcyclotransferase [Aquabacterium sp. A7-Y]
MSTPTVPALPDIPPGLAVPPVRDPQHLLQQTLAGWDPGQDLWVFGYASLIWNPEVEHSERRLARVLGYHRALKMWSRINRGSPLSPGLVFALMSGGSCKGVVLRVPRARAREELNRLWQREMPTGVYDPKWLNCQTVEGPVQALGFTLSRHSPNFTGVLDQQQLVEILREARGRYGTTLDYVLRTDTCLREHGIRDRAVAEVLALARAHRLLP